MSAGTVPYPLLKTLQVQADGQKCVIYTKDTSQPWYCIFTLIYGQDLSMVLIFILWRMYYVINGVISDNINKMQTTLTIVCLLDVS